MSKRAATGILSSVRALRIIAAAFALTTAASLAYALFVREAPIDEFKEEYPYIDIARHLISQEHFLTTLQPIREYLIDTVEREGPESISIYLEYLNTGANVSINQDLRMLPASLVKVPLAMAVMKKVELGEWELHNELVLSSQDHDEKWGELYREPVGSLFTIDRLLTEMIVNSDNTATRILYRNLSYDEKWDVLSALGLEELFGTDGKITAKEYTRLFRALYTSSYLRRESSQYLLTLLTRSPYDEYLGQGIPEEVPFAHKIGDNVDEEVILDAGIVYVENRPYLIAVAIDYAAEGMGRERALELLGDISKRTYEFMTTYEER